jgi:hypothetical protein
MTPLLFGILYWLLAGVVVWTLLRGKLFAVKISVIVCMTAFALTVPLSSPTLRVPLDNYLPYLSLYLHNLILLVAMSSILFAALYHQRDKGRRLLWQIIGLTSALGGVLSWLYFTTLVRSPVITDWTRLDGPPQSPSQLVFAFIVVGYSVYVGGYATLHNWRLFSREMDYLIQSRLLLTVMSLAAMTSFFSLLFMRTISTAVGRQIETALLLPVLQFFSSVALITCGVALLPDSLLKRRRSPLLWILKIRDLLILTPLQQRLITLHPPLFLRSPSWRDKLSAPDKSLAAIAVHVLDMVQLLKDDPRPAAQQVYRLLKQARLDQEQSSVEAVIHQSKKISWQLRVYPFAPSRKVRTLSQ